MKSTIKLRLPLLLSVLLCTLGGYAEELIHPSMLPPSALTFTTTATGSFGFDLKLNADAMVVVEWVDQGGPHHQSFNYVYDPANPATLTPTMNLVGSSNAFHVYVCPEYVSYLDATGRELTTLDISLTTNLEIVKVPDNDLPNVNLADPITSGYPVLTELHLFENPLIQNLDLRHCPELVKLFLSHDNGNPNGIHTVTVAELWVENLSKLEIIATRGCGLTNAQNLQGCTALRDVWMLQNAIPELYLAGLDQLREVIIWGNQIANPNTNGKLDVASSKNTLEMLRVGNNLLSSIDLGTAPYPVLESISAAENYLTNAFDFSNSPVLTSIRLGYAGDGNNDIPSIIVNNCPVLDLLYATDNNLSGTLDLSTCPLLRDVRLHNNQLTNLIVTQNINGTISGLSALQTITAYKNQLVGTIDLSFSDATLINVQLNDNQLSEVIIDPASALLQRLNISDNQLVYPAAGLDLSGCDDLWELKVFGLSAVHTIPQIILPPSTISKPHPLQWIDARLCNLSSISVLTFYQSLETLDLQNNLLTNITINEESMSNISRLRFRNNNLNATSIQSIINAAHDHEVGGGNSTITTRDLLLSGSGDLSNVSCSAKEKLNGNFNDSCGNPSSYLGLDNTTNCPSSGYTSPGTNYNWTIDLCSTSL